MANGKLYPIDSLTAGQIASICDHTFLNRSEMCRQSAKPGESPVRLLKKAFYDFLEKTVADPGRLPYAVCVRPEVVDEVSAFLRSRNLERIVIASVIGFPDGSLYDTAFKVGEAHLVIVRDATEIDMVLNYDRFKAGDYDYALNDVKGVVRATHEQGMIVKLIFEISELSADEIKRACELASEADVDFVKTSTGFSSGGATTEALRIMRSHFDGGVKISGGVNPQNVRELLKAASGRDDGMIELDPGGVRIGESSLLEKL